MKEHYSAPVQIKIKYLFQHNVFHKNANESVQKIEKWFTCSENNSNSSTIILYGENATFY